MDVAPDTFGKGWKVGRLEGWKVGRLESWKVRRLAKKAKSLQYGKYVETKVGQDPNRLRIRVGSGVVCSLPVVSALCAVTTPCPSPAPYTCFLPALPVISVLQVCQFESTPDRG